MLKTARESDLEAILRFCKGDLIGTRIGCYCLCYGFDRDFLSIWIDYCDEEISTVIARFYDSVVLKSSLMNPAEITGFINFIGYSSLESDADCLEKLSIGEVSRKRAYIFVGEADEFSAKETGEEHYKALYSLVSESIPGSFKKDKDAYLSFLSDFTFRKRRCRARSKSIMQDGRLVSCVITSAETDTDALLSAVASRKDVRGGGFGRKTVLSAVNELKKENKNVFVIALNKSAEGFYEHIGFEYYKDIGYIERK